jgi:hypothetical protein
MPVDTKEIIVNIIIIITFTKPSFSWVVVQFLMKFLDFKELQI